MKTIGIIMLIIAAIILLIGIISPINIFICGLIAAVIFVLGIMIIRNEET